MTVTNPDFSPLSFTAQRLPPVDLIGEPARQEHVVQGVQEYLQFTTTGLHMRRELESQAKPCNHILIPSSKSRRADGLLFFRHMCHPGRCHSPTACCHGRTFNATSHHMHVQLPHVPLPTTACHRRTSLPCPLLILSLICPPALSQPSAPTTHPTPAPLKQTSASVHN